MSSIKAGNIKKGIYIEFRSKPHQVMKADFISPGKGSAYMRCRLRNLEDGGSIEFTFKSSENVDELDIASVKMQYLYHDQDDVYFMNQRSYEQVAVESHLLTDQLDLLTEEVEAYVLIYNDKPIGVSLPPKVSLKVVRADEAVAGDTVSQAKKEAELETGLVLQVPLFVKKDDKIIVDTVTKQYVSRG